MKAAIKVLIFKTLHLDMKELLIGLAFFMLSCLLKAQSLYTTTSIGGNGGGTISRLDLPTGTLTADFAFDTEDGGYPAWYSRPVQAADGKLYGMTYLGGSYRNGSIFSYSPATGAYSKLYDFDFQNGGQPSGSLIQAANGKLYGMTNNNGPYGRGVIFSFDPQNRTYTKLFDFAGTNGEFPSGSLLEAADGKLYGMTSHGGITDYGVMFSYDITNSKFTKLKDFDGINGKYPTSDFIQAPDSTLYAMTYQGGKNDGGTIFSFKPATSVFTKLKDFDNTNGSNPFSSFLKASNGKFYSMTWTGGNSNLGVIFSYDPASNDYKKLKDLDYTTGSHPRSNLIQAGNGELYGMTSEGGGYYRGVLFSYNITTATYIKLKDFDGVDGANPYGSLSLSSDNKLYGCTYSGGTGDKGVFFSYDASTGTFTNLRNFGVNATGSLMYGGVVKNSSDKLFGMTFSGGSFSQGTMFSFNPSTAAYTKLVDFDGSNGSTPYGSLMLASDGRFYGMTFYGGENKSGVIFSFDPVAGTYRKLNDLAYINGGNPYGNLLQASNSKLYGMTWSGGANGSGVIFSFDPATNAYTKLFDFDGTNGAYPTGSLMQAMDGLLYGVTYNGGMNDWGVLFSFNPATGVYKKLKQFDASTGINPNGTLVQASNGKLYGMTSYGKYGGIFSYDPSNNLFTTVKGFNYTDGSTPLGSLTIGGNGKLYGVTKEGGAFRSGVAFSYDPVSTTFRKIQDFNGSDGRAPEYSFFTETDLTLSGEPLRVNLCAGGTTTLVSNISGNSYQWKINKGNGFTALTNDSNYTGVSTKSLGLNNLPSSYYGFQYRCYVDGNISSIFSLRFINNFIGTTDVTWENPANWSCRSTPDANTDVIISGKTVTLNSNTSCRSLKINEGGNMTVSDGTKLFIMH
jgi:uncharacterized repeat protein (TIGR03803 family)